MKWGILEKKYWSYNLIMIQSIKGCLFKNILRKIKYIFKRSPYSPNHNSIENLREFMLKNYKRNILKKSELIKLVYKELEILDKEQINNWIDSMNWSRLK